MIKIILKCLENILRSNLEFLPNGDNYVTMCSNLEPRSQVVAGTQKSQCGQNVVRLYKNRHGRARSAAPLDLCMTCAQHQATAPLLPMCNEV